MTLYKVSRPILSPWHLPNCPLHSFEYLLQQFIYLPIASTRWWASWRQDLFPHSLLYSHPLKENRALINVYSINASTCQHPSSSLEPAPGWSTSCHKGQQNTSKRSSEFTCFCLSYLGLWCVKNHNTQFDDIFNTSEYMWQFCLFFVFCFSIQS